MTNCTPGEGMNGAKTRINCCNQPHVPSSFNVVVLSLNLIVNNTCIMTTEHYIKLSSISRLLITCT